MKIQGDEGFFFGIGAFETIAVENGSPIFLVEHYNRLKDTMDFFRIEIPMGRIEAEVRHCLEQTEMKVGRKVLKITVSPENLLVTTRENTYQEKDYQRGFSVEISNIRRNETSPFVYHKTLNYGENLWEKKAFKAKGIDEPVFLNAKGELSEGASTNVFLVKSGKIFTPSVESGLLPGILRGYICRKYEVEERPIRHEELAECEEMFLTNSLLGIMPVDSLGRRRFQQRKIGSQLLREYREYCQSR